MSDQQSFPILLERLLYILRIHNAVWQWYTQIFTDLDLNPVDVDFGVELPNDNSVTGFLRFDHYTTMVLNDLKKEREELKEKMEVTVGRFRKFNVKKKLLKREKKIKEIKQLKWNMISAFSANSREEDPMLYVRVIRSLFHLYPCEEEEEDDDRYYDNYCDHSIYLGSKGTPIVLKQISEMDEEHFREIVTLCGGDPDNLVIDNEWQFMEFFRSLDVSNCFPENDTIMDESYFQFFRWLNSHTNVTSYKPWIRYMKSDNVQNRRMMTRILREIGLPLKSKEMRYDFRVVTFT